MLHGIVRHPHGKRQRTCTALKGRSHTARIVRYCASRLPGPSVAVGCRALCGSQTMTVASISPELAAYSSVGIDLKELRGSDVEMFEILPRDWNFKPIFTQNWASKDMNWGSTPPPGNSNPALKSVKDDVCSRTRRRSTAPTRQVFDELMFHRHNLTTSVLQTLFYSGI